MAPLIYLDTHVAAWLFAGKTDPFPPRVRERIEEHDLLISPAAVLELQYLYEIERVAEPAQVVLDALGPEIGLKVCDLPFPRVAEAALGLVWTRDPFDRLIVAQSMVRCASLLTKDRVIHDHYPHAVWAD
ncbi:MAG TPA: PIN domain-containing protein [Thermoanaerobaculia bacterium]|nr:PIN domain-containing protein [Thermoanaerobaculia bacterium]